MVNTTGLRRYEYNTVFTPLRRNNRADRQLFTFSETQYLFWSNSFFEKSLLISKRARQIKLSGSFVLIFAPN